MCTVLMWVVGWSDRLLCRLFLPIIGNSSRALFVATNLMCMSSSTLKLRLLEGRPPGLARHLVKAHPAHCPVRQPAFLPASKDEKEENIDAPLMNWRKKFFDGKSATTRYVPKFGFFFFAELLTKTSVYLYLNTKNQ